ncbi:radical SAM protein [Candidatus Falkowbacteria bacterium]|nr:radical SAM protein [Candidatus Falkowbacteria bacterium]
MKTEIASSQKNWEDGGCLPLPLASIWITGVCQLKCRHCYEGGGRSRRNHLPIDEIILTLDRLSPFVRSFSFMGGEPLCHPEIAEICDYAKNRLGKYTLLVSNGQAFSENLVERLRGKIDCIKLGMDGMNAEHHDAVRGEGSFDKALRSWRLLTPNIPTMCKFTVNARNMTELPRIASFYQELGAKRLILNGWLRIGNGSSIWNRQFALSPAQMSSINRFVAEELKPKYSAFPISRSCSLDNGCIDHPARTYYVNRDGAVSPCIFSGSLALGNIREPSQDTGALLSLVDRQRRHYRNLHTLEPSVSLDPAKVNDPALFLPADACPH